MSALVRGRGGLGDAIYARPFVKAVLKTTDEVWVETSWPDIFSDLDVRCVKRRGGLAVQAFHGDLQPAETWADAPEQPDAVVSLRYEWRALQRGVSVLAEMERASGLKPKLVLDLPPLPGSPVPGRYAVVRPPAVRKDYPAPAREPDPAYLARAADMLRERGLRVVTLGYWVDGLEEPAGQVAADVRFERGELTLPQALALVAGAELVVSGPCWLLPATLATGTPSVVIAGGCGGRNSPEALVDKRLAARHVRWLLPRRYCRCRMRYHGCSKDIRGFEGLFARMLPPAQARAA